MYEIWHDSRYDMADYDYNCVYEKLEDSVTYDDGL